MGVFTRWENELRYENPIISKRRIQLITLDWKKDPETLEEIFYSIPRNFRKIFMYEAEFSKAQKKCGADFIKSLTKCLKYCIEIIG